MVFQDGVIGVVFNLDLGIWVLNNYYGIFGIFNDLSFSVVCFFNVIFLNVGIIILDMNVEFDMMFVVNVEVCFDIGVDWIFNMLILFNQFVGIVDLNGCVNVCEYMMMGGMLMGIGIFNIMMMWNIGGVVLLGFEMVIGMFDFWGDYVQFSVGLLVINVDGVGLFMFNIIGDVLLDGLLVFNFLVGYLLCYGDSYVFLNVNLIIGGFVSVMDFLGVLCLVVMLVGGQVMLELMVELFLIQIIYINLFQVSFGNVLDNVCDIDYVVLVDIFGLLDLLLGDDLVDVLMLLMLFEFVMFDCFLCFYMDILNVVLMGQICNSGGFSVVEIVVVVQFVELQVDGVVSLLVVFGVKMLFCYNYGGDMEVLQLGLCVFGEVGYVSGDVDLIYGMGFMDLDGEFLLFGFEVIFDFGWFVGVVVGMVSMDMDSLSIFNLIFSEILMMQFSFFGGYQIECFGVFGFYSFVSSEMDVQCMVVMGGMLFVIVFDFEGDVISFGVVVDYCLIDVGVVYQIVLMVSFVLIEFDYDVMIVQVILGVNIDVCFLDSLIVCMGVYFSVEMNIVGLCLVFYFGVVFDFGVELEVYFVLFQGVLNVSFGMIELIDVDEVWYEIFVSIECEFEMGVIFSFGVFIEEGCEVIDCMGVFVGVSVLF